MQNIMTQHAAPLHRASAADLPGLTEEVLLNAGNAAVRLPCPDSVDQARAAMRAYFAQTPDVKARDTLERAAEAGYRRCAVKESFMLRHRSPPALLQPVVQLWQECHALARASLTPIAEDLDMAPDRLVSLAADSYAPPSGHGSSVLRMFRYEAGAPTTLTSEAHVDLGLITLVARSNAPALEGFSDGWRNLEADLPPDGAALLTGLSLQVATDDAVPACLHRVRATPTERYAFVFQLRAEPDAVLSSGHGQPWTAGEFIADFKRHNDSVNGSYGRPL